MTGDTPYNDALKEHYHNPRNRADPSDAQVVRRGRNPRCGDDLEIGVDFDADRLRRVRFRGRGCSICIVSASMMTEAVTGCSREEAHGISDFMHRWFDGDDVADDAAPELLRPLSMVRRFPARQRCVLLAWDALDETLSAGAGG
ncbi:MAG: SUF system NifU family Fe-S cluster assembly protein [Arenicellales bacterium]